MRNILAILLLAAFITACGSTATQPTAVVENDVEDGESANLVETDVVIVGGDDENSSALTDEAPVNSTGEATGNRASQAQTTENFPTDEVGIPDGDVAVTPTLERTPVGVTLPNAVTSADGSLTVNVPEGWFGQSDADNTVIVSNEEALTSGDLAGLESGQAIMRVGVIPREEFEATDLGLSELVQQIGDEAASSLEASAATFGEAAEADINGLPSVTITGSVTVEDQPSDIHIILIDRQEDEVIVQLVMFTANGESVEFEGTAQEVAGSAQVEAMSGTEEADTGEGAAGGTAEVSADNIEEASTAQSTGTPAAGTSGTEGDATEEAGS
jgi:hypothetical protein